MTEMEFDFMGRIGAWAMDNYKGIEDISHDQMINNYWDTYFKTCTMGTEFTGLEMPHEQKTQFYGRINGDLLSGGIVKC